MEKTSVLQVLLGAVYLTRKYLNGYQRVDTDQYSGVIVTSDDDLQFPLTRAAVLEALGDEHVNQEVLDRIVTQVVEFIGFLVEEVVM